MIHAFFFPLLVFLGAIETHKLDKDKIRFEVRIQETWRVDGVAGRLLPKKASANLPPFPIWAKTQESVLTNNRGQKIRCLCPDFKPGEVYLFLTQSYQVPNDNRMELMLDTQSIVLPWRESWRRRLNRFVRRAAKGRCRGVTQDNGPHANGARIGRVQRLRTAPGYYAANFDTDQIVSDGPLRRISMRRASVSKPSRSQPFQRLTSDQTTNQGHRSQSNQPQFTYYNPYMAYDNSKKY
ncbi:hypothetical protein P879_09398 [Paragonimus westermani]|uniref:NTR domain-containing protein n=1 Tax=Paragonimus westermani TaxID=34504 RepID=A0A8T0D2Z8_9TREM|nr:hypothetical protein P879_09398 [Paragonimus westermani]